MDGEAGWWTISGNIGLPPLARAMGVGRQHNMMCGMLVWYSFIMRVCILTVSNALLMSSVTANVRSGGLFWLKLVAIVLFMLCSAVLVQWLPLKPCCVEIHGYCL